MKKIILLLIILSPASLLGGIAAHIWNNTNEPIKNIKYTGLVPGGSVKVTLPRSKSRYIHEILPNKGVDIIFEYTPFMLMFQWKGKQFYVTGTTYNFARRFTEIKEGYAGELQARWYFWPLKGEWVDLPSKNIQKKQPIVMENK